MFIEPDMSGYVYSFGCRIKAAITMVDRAIAKKNTRCGVKINFMMVIRSKIRKTLATKNTKKIIVRFAVIHKLKGRFV